MTSETSNAKLFAKIAAVMSECRTLEKTGRNTYDRYDYVTADAIAIKLGAALAKHKVALLPSITSVETAEYTTQKGGSNFRTVVHMQMTLACGDSGATWTSLWSGEAIDRSDKSISKAAVSATKYFLLKTFLLAGGDEEDADASSPSVTSDGEPAQTPQTRPEQRNGGTQAQSSTQAQKPPQKPATQASEDANPFEDGEPKSVETLSETQHKRLHALGVKLYGSSEWEEQRPKLVQAVSKGAVSSSKELTPQEADTLIKGIEKKIKDLEAQKVAA